MVTQHVSSPHDIIRAKSASFSFAARLFPRELRKDTYTLYAFLRSADDIADSADPMLSDLEKYKFSFHEAYISGAGNGVAAGGARVFRAHAIPLPLADDFFDTLTKDIERKSITTFSDLEKYLYGVGGTVGLMMAHIIGFSDTRAFVYAQKLGEAMQLVNILRDIDEDFRTLGRVYLPAEDLTRFGVSVADIRQRKNSSGLRALMVEYATRARAMFWKGNQGIPLLSRRGRLPVMLASKIYEGILDEIAKQDYNPFAGRARTSSWKKLQSLLAAALEV